MSVQFCERIVTTRTRNGSPDSLATREAAKSSSLRGILSRSTFRICCACSLSSTLTVLSNSGILHANAFAIRIVLVP